MFQAKALCWEVTVLDSEYRISPRIFQVYNIVASLPTKVLFFLL